jgi:hypothetical protein
VEFDASALWVKVIWDEGGLLGDIEPLLNLRDVAASDVAKQRSALLSSPARKVAYYQEFTQQEGTKSFLGSIGNYSLLERVQTNLFKCFVARAWEVGSPSGVAGFIHPEGMYDEPSGGRLRQAVYRRLRWHCQFSNELLLFTEIHDQKTYSVNVYCTSPQPHVHFYHVSNLFNPATIDTSLSHDGQGTVAGIKDENGKWNVRPHRHRIIEMDENRLDMLSLLYDEPGTPSGQTRLPHLHSEEIVHVLEKMASQATKLSHYKQDYYSTMFFDETQAQKDGTIRRSTVFPSGPGEWVVSGPHFFVGTPLAKTPNENCSNRLDYTEIDLSGVNDSYLPRTNYVPGCTQIEYLKRIPTWQGRPVTEFFRHVHRRRIAAANERSLIPCIMPPGAAHINSVVSVAFSDISLLLLFNGLASSIVFDFFVRTTGRTDLYESTLALLPLPKRPATAARISRRVILLNCLTSAYKNLWQECQRLFPGGDAPAIVDLRCPSWPQTSTWNQACPLRSSLSRRNALVELDALAALSLGLTEDELITIFRVQFPVLQQYELDNRYDQSGRLVPNGVFDLAKQHNIDIHQPLNVGTFKGPANLVGEVKTAGHGVTGGIVWEDPKMEPRMKRVYPPPFTKCDREADMRQAYNYFREQLRKEENAS